MKSIVRQVHEIAICFGVATLLSFSHSSFGELQIQESGLLHDLGSVSIISVVEDNEGSLWISTHKNIYRITGESTAKYEFDAQNHLRIPSKNILKLQITDMGDIFASTQDAGLLKLDKATMSFRNFFREGSGESIHPYATFALGHILWIATDTELHRLDLSIEGRPAWTSWDNVSAKFGLISSIAQSNNGSTFISGARSLAKLEKGDKLWKYLDTSEALLNPMVSFTALETDSSGNLILGTSNSEILKINPDNGRTIQRLSIAPRHNILVTKLEWHKGYLIIGTDIGLFFSTGKLERIEKLENPHLSSNISTVLDLHSAKNRVWVGTYEQLNVVFSSQISLHTKNNSNISGEVLAFAEDSNRGFWIGTYSGLYTFNHDTMKHEKFSPAGSIALADHRVSALAIHGETLWIGFYGGSVQSINIPTREISNVSLVGSSHSGITDIAVDQKSGAVWISTHGSGIYRIHKKSSVRIDLGVSRTDSYPLRLLQSKSNGLLVATESSVYRVDEDKLIAEAINFKFLDEGVSPQVYAMAQRNDGSILFGTKAHGIYIWSVEQQRINGLELAKLLNSSPILGSTIYSIEFDDEGHTWCSTDRGLLRLGRDSNSVLHLTKAHGLQDNDFALGSSFKNLDGELFFGGLRGYNSFYSNEILPHQLPPYIQLEHVSISNRYDQRFLPLDSMDFLELGYNDFPLEISFSLLDPFSYQSNRYKYWLEGHMSNWLELEHGHSVAFDDLPPGEYKFHVLGANSMSLWSIESARLHILVHRSPWKTWWAYTLYLLALALAIWTIHRIYYSYIVERHSEALTLQIIETENRAEDEMQEQLELHDELAQSAYRHNRNMLSILEHCLPESEQDNVQGLESTPRGRRYIRALSFLEDCTLYDSGVACVDFHLYVESVIDEVMKDCPVDPRTVVSLNEVSSTPLSVEVASGLAIIVYELAQNSALHAFDQDSPANYFRVISKFEDSANSPGGTYSLTVRDNGQGLPKDALDLAPPGSGLALAKSVSEKLGARISLSIENGTEITVAFDVSNMDDIFA